MNLISGWAVMGLVILALPMIQPTAITVGSRFLQGGVSLTAFASALLGGAIITLMTWMQHGIESIPGRIAAAFLLAAGHLNHAIVMSLDVFVALNAGAHFSYLDWLPLLALAAVGNMIGGTGFVTVLRMVQVGAQSIKMEQARTAAGPDGHGRRDGSRGRGRGSERDEQDEVAARDGRRLASD